MRGPPDPTQPRQPSTPPEGSEQGLASHWEEQGPSDDPAPYPPRGALRAFIVMTGVALVGFGIAIACQALISRHPEWRSVLIWASMISLFVVGCVGPIAVATRYSYRVHGSIRPALWTIARVLVVGLIWSAMTSRPDGDTREG